MAWRRFVFLPDRAHSRWQPSGNRAASENGSGDITPLARCVSDIAERRNAIPPVTWTGPPASRARRGGREISRGQKGLLRILL